MPKQHAQISVYEDMTRAEKKVAQFLYEQNIWWIFEQPVFVRDEKDRARIWAPDFFLPELGIYLEVCGAERKCYDYRKKIYEKNRIPVIFVETYKEKKWQFFVRMRIRTIHEERGKRIKTI